MIRVLVVDDSALVRKTLTEELNRDPGIDVVGSAPDPYVARELIATLRPDVLTLDIEMPRMDGLTFLSKLMKHHPLPVVVVSSLTQKGSQQALQALELGAVEVVAKPRSAYAIDDVAHELVDIVKAAAEANVSQQSFGEATSSSSIVVAEPTTRYHRIIAIGASTGGTQALPVVLSKFPQQAPPTIIVQHMPEHFTETFAQRLNERCAVEVREARDGDALETGVVLIAPGNRHTVIRKHAGGYRVLVKDGPRVSRHKPSVDVLFRSVARYAGPAAVGAILTGMGNDGAQGLLEMKNAGSHTIAQDEASCTVFGMPHEAIKLLAATQVVSLQRMGPELLKAAAQRVKLSSRTDPVTVQ